MRKLLGVIFLLAVLPTIAWAQSGYPTGPFVVGHALRSVQSAGVGSVVYGDAGGAAGSSTFGFGYLTEIGITNTGTPFCINDALISGAYHQLCFGSFSLGGGILSYANFNGATALPFAKYVNGFQIESDTAAGVGLLGTPTAPTQAASDASTKLATTQFVATAIGASGVAPVSVEATNAALALLPTTTTNRTMRTGVTAEGDAPPLLFVAQSGSCAANSMANDKGGCVDAPNGGSWLAKYTDTSHMDWREWGASAAASDNIASLDAALTYQKTFGGCVYVPNNGIYKVGTSSKTTLAAFGAGVAVDEGNCLIGAQAGQLGSSGDVANSSEIDVISDADGISQVENYSGATPLGTPRVNNVRIDYLTIKSIKAVTTASVNQTAGLHRGYGTGWSITHLTLKDWPVCEWQDYSVENGGTQEVDNALWCSQQDGYPNINNGYPLYGTLVSGGTAQMQGMTYINPQSYTLQQALSFSPPNGTGGPYTYTADINGSSASLFAFKSDDLTVYVGGVLQYQGVDYDTSDATPGAPDTTLYGLVDTNATLTAGSPTVTLSTASGLPSSITAGGGTPQCPYTPVIIVTGPGIPPSTCLSGISGTTATLTKNVVNLSGLSGSQIIHLAQAFVANREASCNFVASYTTPTSSCGKKLAVTFRAGHYPGNGVSVAITWVPRWGRAALSNISGSYNTWLAYDISGYDYGVVDYRGGNNISVHYAQFLGYLASLYPQDNDSEYYFPTSSGSTVLGAPLWNASAAPAKIRYNNLLRLTNGYNLALGGFVGLQGTLATQSIAADQNNYNPTGLSAGANRLPISCTVSACTITGIVAPANGTVLEVTNVGTGLLILSNEDSGSAAKNQILFPSGANQRLPPKATIVLLYDETISNWRPLNGTPAPARTSYTPTITCGAGAVGTYSSQTGYYSYYGPQVLINIDVQAAIGTCSGTVSVSLPATSNVNITQNLSASDVTTSNILWGSVASAGTAVQLLSATGTNPTGSDHFVISGNYQQ